MVRFVKGLKKFLLWLLLVTLLVGALVAGVVTYLYQRVDTADLPKYTVSFEGEPLKQCGYEWDIPVVGKWLSHRLEAEPSGEPQALARMPSSRPELQLPPYTIGQLVIKNAEGEAVFEGTATEYAGFAFEADGQYVAQLEVGEQPDPMGLLVQPHGRYLYRFAFEVLAQPTLTLSSTRGVQGSVVGVRITGSLGQIAPLLTTDLAEGATFVAHENAWVALVPISPNQPQGEYVINATVNGLAVSGSIHVYGREIKEVDSYTADGTAAIPYIGALPKKLQPILQICDPDVYWGSTFIQPISGKVVRDYDALEYIDRIDAATLAIAPELAVLNENLQTRRSVNVTMSTVPGRKVVAPAAGRVVFAATVDGGGRTVVIEHGCGLKSIVYLLGRLYVKEGDYVVQGDALGTSQGHTICEMRLHNDPISPWEVWRGQGGVFWAM